MYSVFLENVSETFVLNGLRYGLKVFVNERWRSSCICQIASFRLPHFLYSRERQLLITSVNVMIWYVLKTEDFYPWKIIFLYQD